MKAKHILTIVTLLVGALTLLLVITNFNPPAALAQNNAASVMQQPTPLAQTLNGSEIGSTNGILIMGVVIVLIVTLPLMFQKRK